MFIYMADNIPLVDLSYEMNLISGNIIPPESFCVNSGETIPVTSSYNAQVAIANAIPFRAGDKILAVVQFMPTPHLVEAIFDKVGHFYVNPEFDVIDRAGPIILKYKITRLYLSETLPCFAESLPLGDRLWWKDQGSVLN